MMANRNKKEYGGYIPLELNKGIEYYNDDAYRLLRFNSIKAGLAHVVNQVKPTKIVIPYYYCPSTTGALKALGDVEFYHIGEKYLPENKIQHLCENGNNLDEEGILLVLVDYFGVRYDEIVDIANRYVNATIVIDFAHDFFVPPILKDNIFNVYSAKKFFGIPDGAYLISNSIIQSDIDNWKPSFSDDYNQYLFKSYEQGTNASYFEKKAADGIIANKYTGMSVLAQGILSSVDYCENKKRRQENFAILNAGLRDINNLHVGNNRLFSSYHYPLQFKMSQVELACELRRKLIDNKIYSPILWLGEDLRRFGDDIEKSLANRTVLLPMDQRYDEEDMNYIIEEIYNYIK